MAGGAGGAQYRAFLGALLLVLGGRVGGQQGGRERLQLTVAGREALLSRLSGWCLLKNTFFAVTILCVKTVSMLRILEILVNTCVKTVRMVQIQEVLVDTCIRVTSASVM